MDVINGVGTDVRSTASVADDIAGGYATIGVGRMRHLSSRARWYPRVGVGAGGVTVELDDRQTAISFDEVLRDPTVVDRHRQGMTRARTRGLLDHQLRARLGLRTHDHRRPARVADRSLHSPVHRRLVAALSATSRQHALLYQQVLT